MRSRSVIITLVLCVLIYYIFSNKNGEYIISLNEVSNLEEIQQNQPSFIDYIRRKIEHPIQNTPLKLDGKLQMGQVGQVDEVLKYFNGKKNGFFVEAGAFDGEFLSNTLLLETQYQWTGLLVEANSGAYKKLASKNRNSCSINCCLAVTDHPQIVEFDSAGVFGGIKTGMELDPTSKFSQWRASVQDRKIDTVECYPFYSLLLALGKEKSVDYLSLDVEGAEEAVLKTIPWNKVHIKLISIEVEHSDQEEISRIMEGAGYKVYKILAGANNPNIIQDIIYEKL